MKNDTKITRNNAMKKSGMHQQHLLKLITNIKFCIEQMKDDSYSDKTAKMFLTVYEKEILEYLNDSYLDTDCMHYELADFPLLNVVALNPNNG